VWSTDQNEKIIKNCERVGKCLIWCLGPYKGHERYGQMRFRLPIPGTTWKTVRVHRLIYFLAAGRIEDLYTEHLEVSHLCHVPRCVEPGHLVLEPSVVNARTTVNILLW
jgi:hypothetical protein